MGDGPPGQLAVNVGKTLNWSPPPPRHIPEIHPRLSGQLKTYEEKQISKAFRTEPTRTVFTISDFRGVS